MPKKTYQLYKYLTFAGALPFVFVAVLLSIDIHSLPVLGHLLPIIMIYGLIIVSFLAGIHWGQCISLNFSKVPQVMMISNFSVLVVWLCYFVFPNFLFAWPLILLFSLMLIVDFYLYRAANITKDYFKTRVWVSLLVLISLFAIATQG